jgi:RNA polymerase sigma-54 factor
MTSLKLEEPFDMLHLSRIELQKLIRTQLLDNPALELDDPSADNARGAGPKRADSRSLVPDVRIERNGHAHVVVFNHEDRRLRVSPLYERLAGQKVKIEGHVDYPFFIEKARSARWFIKAVEQRENIIVKVTESVFKFQRDLLQRGLSHIRPMRLRDVAEDIRLPESIVSRAAANKWVETPQAIFALDWFFSEPKPDKKSKP